MPDYDYGKIYKIVSESSGLVYIGSTTQTLSSRMGGHRRKYKGWLKTGENYCCSYKLLEQGDAKIDLICKFSCKNKKELCREEGKYQLKMECINHVIAGRTKKEYYEVNKEKFKKRDKDYYEKNKETVKIKAKQYRDNNPKKIKIMNKKKYEKNKEKIKKRYKDYYEKNKEKIKIKDKEYRENNKEKILMKQRKKKYCPVCDCHVTTGSFKRHTKSKKHLNNSN